MLKPYEVTYKDGNELKTLVVKGYTLIGSIVTLTQYEYVYKNLVSIKEISFERYHVLDIASAIREADTWLDCEEECVELCRMANMESDWTEANDETFEAVLIEAAKKLNVEI